jgi:hypothetical protein
MQPLVCQRQALLLFLGMQPTQCSTFVSKLFEKLLRCLEKNGIFSPWNGLCSAAESKTHLIVFEFRKMSHASSVTWNQLLMRINDFYFLLRTYMYTGIIQTNWRIHNNIQVTPYHCYFSDKAAHAPNSFPCGMQVDTVIVMKFACCVLLIVVSISAFFLPHHTETFLQN